MKRHKQLTIAICAFGLLLSVLAQTPQFINYQGRLTDQTGAPLVNETNNAADGQIDLAFRIYDASANGNVIWSQVQPDVAVFNGLFSVLLSGLNETNFPATNQIARWLEVEVKTSTTTNTLSPRKELVSVAYALRAGDADMVDGFHAGEFAMSSLTNEIIALQTATNYLQLQVVNLQDATNALNLATNTLQGQIIELTTATNNLQLQVGALNDATNNLNDKVLILQNATNNLQTQVVNLQNATNALNLATNSLQAQLGMLATSAVTKAQDPMIISNGIVIWHYDTNDFVLRGQVGVRDKWVDEVGDTMTGDLIMQAPARIVGINIIDSDAITDGTIRDVDISDSAVISAKIADGTIAEIDISDSAITSTKILNDTIADADISPTANIAGSKVVAASETAYGTVRLATSTDTADGLAVQASDTRLSDPRAPGGAASGDLTGTYPDPQIAAGVIVDADIAVNANIAASKINEADPTVVASVKDGVSWIEIQNMPAEFADGDNVGITTETDPQVDDNTMTLNTVPRWNDTTKKLVGGSIYDNGNVGIGTANPDGKLDVAGNSQLLGFGRKIYAHNDPNNYYIGSYPIAGSDGLDIHWYGGVRLGTGAGTVLQTTRDGNVGIGTTSPNAGLDINRAGPEGSLAIRNSYAGGITYFDYPNGKNYIRGTTIMADTVGNNVGIGTANPQARLDVRGQLLVDPGNIHAAPFSESALIEGAGLSVMNNAGTGDSYIYIGKTTATANYGYIGYDYSESKLKLFNFGDITFEQTGNVGIGTATPDPRTKLFVEGKAGIRNDFYVYQMGIFGGGNYPLFLSDEYGRLSLFANSSAGAYGNLYYVGSLLKYSSDTRIKLDQKQLDYGLTQVMALKPKRYNLVKWEQDKETGNLIIHPEIITKTNEIGLVAQDVQKVIPEAIRVPEDENRGLWSLCYEPMIPVLIRAIQEQQAQIDGAQRAIEALKQEKQVLKASASFSDTPLTADFDGDGKTDRALVDSSGQWYFWLSGSEFVKIGPHNFGVIGKPVVGDFDGDGKADPGILDSDGNWYVWLSASGYSQSKL